MVQFCPPASGTQTALIRGMAVIWPCVCGSRAWLHRMGKRWSLESQEVSCSSAQVHSGKEPQLMVFNNRALKYSSNRLFISEVLLHLPGSKTRWKTKMPGWCNPTGLINHYQALMPASNLPGGINYCSHHGKGAIQPRPWCTQWLHSTQPFPGSCWGCFRLSLIAKKSFIL